MFDLFVAIDSLRFIESRLWVLHEWIWVIFFMIVLVIWWWGFLWVYWLIIDWLFVDILDWFLLCLYLYLLFRLCKLFAGCFLWIMLIIIIEWDKIIDIVTIYTIIHSLIMILYFLMNDMICWIMILKCTITFTYAALLF